MLWSYILISIIILLIILGLLSHFNAKIKLYLQKKYPELVVNILILSWSVFFGAILALEFTKQLNENDDKKNYLSMLNSCKNMNERYIKNFTEISNALDSGLVDFSEMNRLVKNINEPYLLEEIAVNSNLYKCSSRDFRNWLPDIISFMKRTNWTLTKDNIELFKYNNQFLLFLKEVMSNEESFITDELSEKRVAILNNESRLRYKISTEDISISDIIIGLQNKELIDSNNIYIKELLKK